MGCGFGLAAAALRFFDNMACFSAGDMVRAFQRDLKPAIFFFAPVVTAIYPSSPGATPAN